MPTKFTSDFKFRIKNETQTHKVMQQNPILHFFKHDMIAKQKMAVSKANKEDGGSLSSQSKLPCSSCYSSNKQIRKYNV